MAALVPAAPLVQGWTIFRNAAVVTNEPVLPKQQENLKKWQDYIGCAAAAEAYGHSHCC